jgi:hypothetical protein
LERGGRASVVDSPLAAKAHRSVEEIADPIGLTAMAATMEMWLLTPIATVRVWLIAVTFLP